MIVYNQRNYDFRTNALVDYAVMIGQYSHNNYPMKNRELLESGMAAIERVFASSFGFGSGLHMRSFATKLAIDVDRQGWEYESLARTTLQKPYDFYREMNRNRNWVAAYVNHFFTVLDGDEVREVTVLPDEVPATDVVRVPTKPIVASFDPDA